MNAVLYLAWQHLLFYRVKSTVLVGAVALVVYIPAGLWVLSLQSEQHLRARSIQTPLLIGERGSPLELTLNSLYYRSRVPAPMRYGEVATVQASHLALPIPLYVRFRCQDSPIVGTTIDYFRFRELELRCGRLFARLGECVIGASVARRRQLAIGDKIVSTPEQAFDVAGVFPLRMKIVGILLPTDSPDDDAVFTDLKTTWVIEGIGHGHQDLVGEVGKPVDPYTEVTDENLESFHFHGELKSFPITAIVAVPTDERAGTRLLGRYQSRDQRYQAIEPQRVIDELLQTVVTLRSFALTAASAVIAVTFGLIGLIETLSLRLRQREIEILGLIGGSPWRIGWLLAAEGVGVLILGTILAAGLTGLTAWYGPSWVRGWLSA